MFIIRTLLLVFAAYVVFAQDKPKVHKIGGVTVTGIDERCPRRRLTTALPACGELRTRMAAAGYREWRA